MMKTLDDLATQYLYYAERQDVYSACVIDGIAMACAVMPQALTDDTVDNKIVNISRRLDFKHQWQQMLEENWDNIEFA